ncbi:hypothetical protein [Acinetobacter sp. ANC 4648]|uniref:hypothetical protein n=1 Tax=Acinetobacter sp. ANC 4648 TaxID=1977875 RepID=UPI000A341ABC|nr:hypothetical protein [Acinetobacter sp. ANC 4648]OTG83040.1 hypothetical protein B9T27_07150 [Acinetobacter sp. ANC 4648]
MNPKVTEKKPLPWLLMGLGLLVPVFIIVMAFFAAKSDAETKKKYQQQHAEIAKKHAQMTKN